MEELGAIVAKTMFRYSIDQKLNFDFVSCNLTSQEMSDYIKVGRGIADEAGNLRDFVARLPQLQLLVNNSVNVEGEVNRSMELSTKEKKLVEVLNSIADRNEAVILFTFYKLSYERLFRIVIANCRFAHVWRMYGQTSSFERESIVSQFVQGDCLISTAVGGQSLNLQEANNIVFYDGNWSVGVFMQASRASSFVLP